MTFVLAQISGSAEVDAKERGTDWSKGLKFKFFGDVRIGHNPTNLKEAIEIQRQLPMRINMSNSVPVVIHLLPLEQLDSKGKRIVRRISASLLNRVERRITAYEELERDVADLHFQPSVKAFSTLSDTIKDFQSGLNSHRAVFERELLHILPKV